MTKLSPEERAKRLEAVQYARATNALEGARPSPLVQDLQVKWINGEITIEESIAEALRHYGLPKTPEPRQG
ncbi:MAG: antitoxin VbhA family protein [Pseudomonadaceae bacterium]|nr:antitoxin VbhA family protein [Pseudomonadaceae bacterium]